MVVICDTPCGPPAVLLLVFPCLPPVLQMSRFLVFVFQFLPSFCHMCLLSWLCAPHSIIFIFTCLCPSSRVQCRRSVNLHVHLDIDQLSSITSRLSPLVCPATQPFLRFAILCVSLCFLFFVVEGGFLVMHMDVGKTQRMEHKQMTKELVYHDCGQSNVCLTQFGHWNEKTNKDTHNLQTM